MKKIIAIVFASLALFFVTVSNSLAEWTAGVSGTVGVYEADGRETSGTEGEIHDASEVGNYAFPSVFVEYNTGTVSIGLDLIPGEVQSAAEERTDTGVGDNSLKTGNDATTNTAQVALSQHLTLYALVPIMDSGAYLKAGVHSVNIKSQESLGTGSKYGDERVMGGTIALGYQHDTDGGFIRLEAGVSDYEDVSLNSTNTSNKVSGSLRGGFGRVSIGRSF
jgi:hypothetical protein